jgi:hypothetical protein
MAKVHKAYLFDTRRFKAELAPVLKKAGPANDPGPLRTFLTGRGVEVPERAGVRKLSASALMLYYDARDDRGLALGWESVLFNLGRLTSKVDPEYVVLGNRYRAGKYVLDPGGKGTGLVDAKDVSTLTVALSNLRRDVVESSFPPQDGVSRPLSPAELYRTYDDLLALYRDAREAERGLLMTF